MKNGNTDKKMNNSGFSLIETLTALVILGIIMAVSVMLLKGLLFSPRDILRNEALVAASTEIDRSLSKYIMTDTSFVNNKGNLIVTRKTSKEDQLFSITVRVCSKQNNSEILRLHAFRHIEE